MLAPLSMRAFPSNPWGPFTALPHGDATATAGLVRVCASPGAIALALPQNF